MCRFLQLTIRIVHFSICIAPAFGATPYTPVSPDPVLESWRWTRYPQLNGLGLRCIAQARDGAMWFGGGKGIVRYDGVNWTSYTEADGIGGPTVLALLGASDGSVYAGSPEGLSRFADGEWRRVFPMDEKLVVPVHDLVESEEGRLLAATNVGVLRIGPADTLLLASPDVAQAMSTIIPSLRTVELPRKLTNRSPWGEGGYLLTGKIGYYGSGQLSFGSTILAVAEGGPASRAGIRQGDRVRGYTVSDSVLALWMDREGESEPVEVSLASETPPGGFDGFAVGRVFQDRDGRLWLGRWGKYPETAVACYDPGKGGFSQPDAWDLYTDEDGLDVGAVPHLAQTPDGTIWVVSTHGGRGVNRFDGTSWSSLQLTPDLGGQLHSGLVTTGDGTLWAASGGGLQALVDGSWRYHPFPELPSPWLRVRLLEAQDGALWLIGHNQDAARLDISTKQWRSYEGLAYWCETQDGSEWFIAHPDRRVVRRRAGAWVQYGPEDGLLDASARLLVSRTGELWTTGRRDSMAAIARFDGARWAHMKFPTLAYGTNASFEDREGRIWVFAFGADARAGHTGGVVQLSPPGVRMVGGSRTEFGNREVRILRPPEFPARNNVYGIAQTDDGHLWAGGAFGGMVRHDGQSWTRVPGPPESGIVDAVVAGREGGLWVGSRTSGIHHYNGETWTGYGVSDGLASNAVSMIMTDTDGTVWAGSSRSGLSRFDGQGWTSPVFPHEGLLGLSAIRSRDGSLWLTGGRREYLERAMAVWHRPEDRAPETRITLSVSEVSQPGNTTVAWVGTDPWEMTAADKLQYTWRLDGGVWSAYAGDRSVILEALASGDHVFEVKARDLAFNEDPTPAMAHFTVVPPVWQEPWFIGLMAVMLGAIGFQTSRVIRRDRRLREGNVALSAANKDLFGLNQNLEDSNKRLDLERAVERVRAEITSMTSPDDLKAVIQEMLKELSAAGVDYNLCVVNIIDEEAGTRTQYGATREVWAGEGTMPLSEVSDDFMALYRSGTPATRSVDDQLSDQLEGTWDRVGTAGKVTRPTAVLDVPFSYGTLSLSTTSENGFGDEDAAVVGEFARVMALGYARFLDFQRLEVEGRERAKEAALERIRAEVASMALSDDIGRIIAIVLREARNLGIEAMSAVVMVPDEEAGLSREYMAGLRDTSEYPEPSETPVFEPAVPDVIEGYDLFRGDQPLEKAERWILGLWREGRSDLQEDLVWVANNPEKTQENQKEQWGFWCPREWLPRTSMSAPFSHGLLHFYGLKAGAFTQADLEIAADFANMVSLGYARFLDFQLLEAEGRERTKEAALHRIRAEVASMSTSDDIGRIMGLITLELRGLGLVADETSVMIPDEEKDFCRQYALVDKGLYDRGVTGTPEVADIVPGLDLYRGDRELRGDRDWILQTYRSQRVLAGEIVDEDTSIWWHPEGDEESSETMQMGFRDQQEQFARKEGLHFPMEVIPRHFMAVPFSHGLLWFAADLDLTQEYMGVAKDFAHMVSLGYARFLDFQKLEEQNRAMSDANKELYRVNRELQRERAVERIREKVQTMEGASDFEAVLSLLADDLKTAGLAFETCGIEVVDEPVDEPSMSYFKEHGYRYTAYTIDPEGAVSSNPYTIPAPFPPVNLEAIQRFIEGQPWQAFTGGTNAILEVPAAGYGRLRLTTSDRKEYSDEEVEMLRDFAGAVAMGYARFLDLKAVEEARQREMEELEKELQVAHDMQMGLLPEGPPEVEGMELSGICVPANHVGGDYFQYVPMEEGRLGIVVADVSGHAMQAATVAMRFNEMLRYELRGRTSPTEILEGLDRSLKGQIPETMFVTCGIGVWDPSDRSFAFASAANPEVYRFAQADGGIKPFGIQGIPLGLQLPTGVDAPFGSTKVTLDPGDLLVFTSDGVEEALDGSEAFYEAERLAALVGKLGQAGASADEMRDGITEDVKGFIGSAAQSDDITVVVVKAT